jgi:hypothetical protein
VTETRLDEFDREEWWDVARKLRPDWTREQFDAEWDDFQRSKAERQRSMELQ